MRLDNDAKGRPAAGRCEWTRIAMRQHRAALRHQVRTVFADRAIDRTLFVVDRAGFGKIAVRRLRANPIDGPGEVHCRRAGVTDARRGVHEVIVVRMEEPRERDAVCTEDTDRRCSAYAERRNRGDDLSVVGCERSHDFVRQLPLIDVSDRR